MSLLLQALQKAAKNRESGAAPAEEALPMPPPTFEPPAAILPPAFALDATADAPPREPELTLAEEDLFEPDEPLPDETVQRFEPFGASPPSPADAAAILRANETPSAGWIDWLRDRPVWALAIGATVFLAFYFVYVYLQIVHPGILRGDFMHQPLASKVPPPAPARPLNSPPKPVVTPRDPPPAPTIAKANPPLSATATPGPVASPGVDTKPSAVVALPPPVKPAQPTGQVSDPRVVATAPAIERAAPALPPAVEPGPEVMPRIPAKPERSIQPIPVQRAAPAMPRTGDPPTTERSVNREQAVRGSPMAKALRPRRESAGPVVSVPALEHEISSNPVTLASASVAPTVKEAYQALQDGRLEQAETLYRRTLQSDAQNVDALLGLAALSVQRGQPQQAIGFYEHALEAEPRNPVAQAGLIALIGQADPQMSETRLKQLIAREPSAFLLFNLGNLYAAQNQWPAAQQAYYQAYQMQPDNPDYAYNLAVGLEHLNQPKLALTYYRKAIELSFQKGRANFDQKRVIERIGQLSARVD